MLNKHLSCLLKGHSLSTFTYKGEDYQYCLRCGKLSLLTCSKKHRLLATQHGIS